MESTKEHHQDMSWFESFDTKWNITLTKARNTLERLSKLIYEHNWTLGEPMIVWLHGWPGLGKTHLLNAFEKSILTVSGAKIHRPDRKYGFSQHQSRYHSANTIINDDLFQEFQSLEDTFKIDTFLQRLSEPEVRHMWEFIFDLYDGKKIWIVSSNFDIKEILQRIAQIDKQDRLKSRIDHLIATTWVLHLEWEDHRRILAQTGTRFADLFKD